MLWYRYREGEKSYLLVLTMLAVCARYTLGGTRYRSYLCSLALTRGVYRLRVVLTSFAEETVH